MTEAELQVVVINLCDRRDPPLPWIHIGDSRRVDAGGPWRQGFPDMLIVGQHHAITRELKGDGGELQPRQNVWLTWLCQAGMNADVWTPASLRDGTIERELTDLHWPRPDQPPETNQERRLRELYIPRMASRPPH